MAGAFELVISLGAMCQPAYQIEKRYGHRTSSPFDWIVTPLDAIGKILLDDGDSFTKSIRVEFNGYLAICNHYDVAYQHDFPRTDKGLVTLTPELMQTSRRKMLHKFSKFKNLMESDTKTLFIRLGGHHDYQISSPYREDSRQLRTNDLNDLCIALTKRFPRLDFELAFVFIKEFTQVDCDFACLDKRVKVFELAYNANDQWFGDISSWSRIFNSFHVNLRLDVNSARQFAADGIGKEGLY